LRLQRKLWTQRRTQQQQKDMHPYVKIHIRTGVVIQEYNACLALMRPWVGLQDSKRKKKKKKFALSFRIHGQPL
jgi:hypothetical protein